MFDEVEKLIEKINLPKFVVIGSYEDITWNVRGFWDMTTAQKYIDDVNIALADAKEYLDMIPVEDKSSENVTLIERLHTKFGFRVFGNRELLLNTERPTYIVERLEFDVFEK